MSGSLPLGLHAAHFESLSRQYDCSQQAVFLQLLPFGAQVVAGGVGSAGGEGAGELVPGPVGVPGVVTGAWGFFSEPVGLVGWGAAAVVPPEAGFDKRVGVLSPGARWPPVGDGPWLIGSSAFAWSSLMPASDAHPTLKKRLVAPTQQARTAKALRVIRVVIVEEA